jgi:hypothetical protein
MQEPDRAVACGLDRPLALQHDAPADRGLLRFARGATRHRPGWRLTRDFDSPGGRARQKDPSMRRWIRGRRCMHCRPPGPRGPQRANERSFVRHGARSISDWPRARRSSPPLDVVAGQSLSLSRSRPLGSVRFLRICIHSSPWSLVHGRPVWCAFCLVWPTTRHGAGSTHYRSGLCPLLVLSLSCLFRGCFIGTLLPTHRDEIVPSHNFDGHFPDSPQLYMCVLNERKKRAHVVYRGGRGSGGQYRVERELLYFSTS